MMTHSRWLLVALLPLAAGCVSRSSYSELEGKYAQANRRIQELEGIAQASAEEADKYRGDVSRYQQDANNAKNQLRTTQEQSARTIADLSSQVNDLKNRQPKIDNVDIYVKDGALVFDIKGDVLFDSGKDSVKASARQTLAQVAEQLRSSNDMIEVAGHTDTDPVVKTKDRFPNGNIQLGSARAISVWNELKAAGIPENRMLVSSYGEYDPRGADKATNRRVEIRLRVGRSASAKGT